MIENGIWDSEFAQYEMRSNMFFDDFESEAERDLAFNRGGVNAGLREPLSRFAASIYDVNKETKLDAETWK